MRLLGPPNVKALSAKRNVAGLTKAVGYQQDPEVQQDAFTALLRLGQVGAACHAARLLPAPVLAIELLTNGLTDKHSDLFADVLDMTSEKEKRLWAARRSMVEALDALGWEGDRTEAAAWYWVINGDFERCVPLGNLARDPLSARIRELKEQAAETGDPLPRSTHEAIEGVIGALICLSVQTAVFEVCRNLDGGEGWESAVAEVLGNRGEEAIVELIDRLREGSMPAAARILGRIGGPRAIEELIATARKPNLIGTRSGDDLVTSAVYAVEALGTIGDPRAIDVLIELRHSSWTPIREAVGSALAAFGVAGRQAIIDELIASPWSGRPDADLLDSMGWPPWVSSTAGAAYRVARQEWNACPKHGAAAIGALIGSLTRFWEQQKRLPSRVDADPMEDLARYMDDDSPGHSTYRTERDKRLQVRADHEDVRTSLEGIADALRQITGQSFGTDPTEWTSWLEANPQ